MTNCKVCKYYDEQQNGCRLFNVVLTEEGTTQSCDIDKANKDIT